ncbi:MAG: transposase [Undibacterium sp.]|nr:transposase [Opitutaceae bacterium]
MARKLRLEYEGAIYHVLNRGNYRQAIFGTVGAAAAFERCLFETCARSGWRLHAYVIMHNHYHLALETPRGNLATGMHWLQGTFATRFNRLRAERGHLFQGRYQAILVQPGPALARVADYIHLNPVRAGLVPVAQAAAFRWGSLGGFTRGIRPEWLVAETWLRELGLNDTPGGWTEYGAHLQRRMAEPENQESDDFGPITSGWAIGTHAWRQAIAKEHAGSKLAGHAHAGPEARALREAQWAEALAGLLAQAGKTREEATDDWKAAVWKIELAAELRRLTDASNRWIAEQLHMGTAGSVSKYLSVRAAQKAG